MKFEWLTDPTDDAPPCGPDLEAEDDDAFIGYYYEAEGRLPERYFTPGLAPDGSEDRLFDPRSISFAREGKQIGDLLRRSRDLRLTSLLARFAILSGRLEDFADAVEATATLMQIWPNEAVPRVDRSAAERRGAIEALNTQPTVVMPLLHLALLPTGDVTLRRHMVATGRAEARASEEGLDGTTDVLGPLRSDANRALVARTQAELTRVAAALNMIARLAASHPGAPFSPDLAAVRTAVADMQAMISTARPDLPGWTEGADTPAADPGYPQLGGAPAPAASDATPAAALPAAPSTPAAPVNAPLIADRDAALAALKAAEAWMALREPSSPSLLLITQARLLVGAPLVQALETLLPAQAGGAMLNIGHASGFALPMERLKTLSSAAQENRPEAVTPPPAPAISDRRGLTACLIGVEAYYAQHEPASPVPLLLVKARDMLTKRFDAIVAELIAAPVRQGE
ncbi:type VI secretion system ImpA family N-terminal domain-containing protein [Paracoccus sp. S1E-3]|uniref:type VI secretion system ImpA family N-terminal domain-containing protein n=1 Tax=Paracoccus sp. S1E-3 TaxID=2756130 RepID=UPI0015EEE118|nr:type VI secretion system ImpA family N-terminal domain-containing protein [Paracoccus sp. S1E-3]MBA4492624.1 type VI secretion system ImpA family N-terminal domain-containing protein [Paracoccus sp. S1E-3]